MRDPRVIPPLFVIAAGWFVGPWWPPVSPPENTGPPTPPVTHHVTVSANGNFNPPTITVDAGETVSWQSVGHTDSIVSYNDVVADACDPANAVAYTTTLPFGPDKSGIPGMFVRMGSSEQAEIITWPGDCPFSVVDGHNVYNTEPSAGTCCDSDQSPSIGDGEAYCDDQGTEYQIPDVFWDMEEISGELLIIDWKDLQTGHVTFDWTPLDHDLDAAADHGKFITIAIKTGQGAVPSWLFDDLHDAGASDDVTPVVLKGTNSDDNSQFGNNDCGDGYSTGSHTDPNYVRELDEFITAMGTHVKSDGAWVGAVSAVLLMGIHIQTDEFQVMTTCPDDFMNTCAKGGPVAPINCNGQMKSCADSTNGRNLSCSDGVLDSYGTDDCVCNTAAWGMAVNGGWSMESLTDFVEEQVETWHDAWWPHLVVRFGLKQAGLPAAPTTAGAVPNFANDDILGHDGLPICPTCVSGDDNQLRSSSTQVDAIISRGLGEFGDLFWVMHHGLDPLKMEFEFRGEVGATDCPSSAAPDLLTVPESIPFPIPLVGPVGNVDACPNKWANNTTITPPTIHMTGFQTNNASTINNPATYESSIKSLLSTTNGVYHEGYAGPYFENFSIHGSSGDMNPDRYTSCPLGTPTDGLAGWDPQQCFSNSGVEYSRELINRRDSGVFSRKAYPVGFSYTFTVPGTYLYYNARTCSDGVGKVGRVVVLPGG